MTEQRVREIFKDELKKGNFNLPSVPPHKHDGVDNLKISSGNLIYPAAINGTIDMAQATTYTLGLTGIGFIPRTVTFFGGALNTSLSPKVHAMVTGSAIFGTNQQFQPDTTTVVKTGPVVENIIQGSAAIIVENTLVGNTASTIIKNSQGHIVYVEYPSGTIVADATITSITNDAITVVVNTLASNWTISGLWTVA